MTQLLESLIRNDMLPSEKVNGAYAKEWAGYKQALQRVIDLLDPEPRDMRGITPVTLMDEAAVALCMAAWHAGTVVGAAFADTEAVLDSAEFRICLNCQGYGRSGAGAERCRVCRGAGFVPADPES